MAAEQVDDARRAAQIGAVARDRVPGEERLEQMHMRIGAPHLLAGRRLEKAGQAAVLEMRVEKREGLLAEPQRVRVAAPMRVGERQQHAGMVVGVLGRIGDAAVHIERAHPAAAVRAALAGHEVQAMGDQPVGRAVPAARLGDSEGVDLPRHGAHALRLLQRRGVEAQRLVEAAMTSSTPAVDQSGSVSSNSQWRTRRRQAPLTSTRSGAGVNLVSSRPLFSSCSTIFLTFWLWLTGATKVASAVETMATSFRPIADSSRPSLRR